MSMPHMNNFNDLHSSLQQMQSPAPSLQSEWLASPLQEAAERQHICSWMIHQLHNMPVEKSRGTIRNFMFKATCSKTDHADKAAKIVGMLLMYYHGDSRFDEYVFVMSDIDAFQAKCEEVVFTLMSHILTPQGSRTGTSSSSDSVSNFSGTENFWRVSKQNWPDLKWRLECCAPPGYLQSQKTPPFLRHLMTHL